MDFNELKKNKLLLGIVILVIIGILLIPVIVIALAGLFYLGVFDVSPPPEVCVMPVGMNCVSSRLAAERLDIELVSGFQKKIVITHLACTKKTDQQVEVEKQTVSPGQKLSFSIPCRDESGNPMSFKQGDAYSGKINVQYYFEDEGPSMVRRVVGNVYAKAG